MLDEWRMAPVSEALRATLKFLEALTLRPTEVTAATLQEVKAAGVSDQGVREAT